LIPLFLCSHLHYSSRLIAEDITNRLSALAEPELCVTLVGADAHQGRASARWVSLTLFINKGHGYPNAEPEAALGSLSAVLDSVEGQEVRGFGKVHSGHLAAWQDIRDCIALAVTLDVEAAPDRLPDSRFRLDERALINPDTHAPEEVAA
jgi:hypothetical protein